MKAIQHVSVIKGSLVIRLTKRELAEWLTLDSTREGVKAEKVRVYTVVDGVWKRTDELCEKSKSSVMRAVDKFGEVVVCGDDWQFYGVR